MRTTCLTTSLTLGWLVGIFTPLSLRAAETVIAHSTGPGQWVAHYSEPLDETQLKPFVGQYLRSGPWPAGVTRPDDPKLLLDRTRLGAARVAALKLEGGGRLVRLATDPVISPEVHSLKLGDVTLAISFHGLAAKIGPADAADMGPKIVLPRPMNRKKLAEYAALDPRLKELEQAWTNPKENIQLSGWLRLPAGEHKIIFNSGREFSAECNGEKLNSKPGAGQAAVLSVESAGTEMELKLTFPPTSQEISATAFLECTQPAQPVSAAATRPLSESAFLVPWAPEPAPEATVAIAPPPYELKGGNAAKGKAVFYSEAAKCSQCHAVAGQGGKIGPDLTGLKGKSPQLVFHHINTQRPHSPGI
jgi:mono/diheme cytochrome c family protein